MLGEVLYAEKGRVDHRLLLFLAMLARVLAGAVISKVERVRVTISGLDSTMYVPKSRRGASLQL